MSVLLAGSKGDPFVADFLGKSKNTGLSERKYVHSWVHQIKHGGLFNKLHSFEKSRKLQRRAWREKQLVRTPAREAEGGEHQVQGAMPQGAMPRPAPPRPAPPRPAPPRPAPPAVTLGACV